mmetsp:Transcript_4960/g.14453  ORF Transcript_4960/g.14453 Transcript_4960/m.14453 type:complete len:221 (+) Transcript_4960:350-1012(+)
MIIHHFGFGIDVTEEYTCTSFWFHMDIGILEIGVSASFWDCAVDHHCRHPISVQVWRPSAFAVAMRCVPIGLGIVVSAPKVLDGHQALLPFVRQFQSLQHVVGVIVHAARQPRHQIALGFLGPLGLDARLHRLSIFGQLRSSLTIGDRGTSQFRLRGSLHGLAFFGRGKVLHHMDPAGGTIQLDVHGTRHAIAFIRPIPHLQIRTRWCIRIDACHILHLR